MREWIFVEWRWIIAALLLCCGSSARAESTFFESVGEDYKHYYGGPSLARLSLGLGVGAALAESNADHSLRESYQSNIKGRRSNEFSRSAKTLGENNMVLLYVGLMPLGYLPGAPAGALSQWGQMNVRSLLVGWPPMMLSQAALGGNRPKEGDSGFKPFGASHGVSGHAFLGALPFLTAAQMTDNRGLKTMFYVGSTATGLSRVNDGMHYTSQVFLGWWFAYAAVGSVARTNARQKEDWFTLQMDPESDSTLLVYTKQF